jgi:hypothetical protein
MVGNVNGKNKVNVGFHEIIKNLLYLKKIYVEHHIRSHSVPVYKNDAARSGSGSATLFSIVQHSPVFIIPQTKGVSNMT